MAFAAPIRNLKTHSPQRSARPASVLILYSEGKPWTRGEAYEQIADHETASTAHATASALADCGYRTMLSPVSTLGDVRVALDGRDPGSFIVYNLCEALDGTAGAEAHVPALLESLGFSYVGADHLSYALCLDKGLAKARLLEYGVPTAPYQIFSEPHAPLILPFPLLVKALYEDSSVGLTPSSLVWDETSLRRQVSHVLATYRQPALVETFLQGREFYVSIWDAPQPTVLAISQADYSNAPQPALAFDHFEAKWQGLFGTICPAPLDGDTDATLRATALAAYLALGCRDYARVDLREHDGCIYVLEVNPNPSLHPDDGFPRAAQVAGYSYREMADHLVQHAWRRPVP